MLSIVMHGCGARDSAVYNEAQTERAWSRLLGVRDRATLARPGRHASSRTYVGSARRAFMRDDIVSPSSPGSRISTRRGMFRTGS